MCFVFSLVPLPPTPLASLLLLFFPSPTPVLDLQLTIYGEEVAVCAVSAGFNKTGRHVAEDPDGGEIKTEEYFSMSDWSGLCGDTKT